MKKLILLLLLAVPVLASAQTPLTYSKVIQADSAKKEEIYSTLVTWFGTHFYNVNNGDLLSDKEAGYIIKSAAIPYVKDWGYVCYGGFVDYKMKFQIKDGRFKLELLGFTHRITKTNCAFNSRMGTITDAQENPVDKGMNKSASNKVWKELQKLCEDESVKLFTEFEKLNYKEYKSTNDNW